MNKEALGTIKYLVGDAETLENAPKTPALPIFSDLVVEFLSALSKELLSVPGIRNHTDVMSYAYWIRKASVEQARKDTERDDIHRIGRGVAFHIAPSNVPVNFAVSMTSSLLAGNITVIRVSQKAFEEVDIICSAINRVFSQEEFTQMKQYICIMRYEHSDEITGYLSSICDVRIIWGGDRTIEQIRRYPIPPRAIEMCFADRHSIAVIRPEEYLDYITEDGNISDDKMTELAKKFYTDTYYSDQNACSSPRIIIWLEDKASRTKEVRDSFWNALAKEVDSGYEMQPIQAIDKLSMFTELSMKKDGVHLEKKSNKLYIISLDELSDDVMDYKMGGGYFFEFTASSINDIISIMGKNCQTVAVLGIDKKDMVDFVMDKGVRGVDRVVDIGDTMGLEFTWDGYRMIEQMSRVVYIYTR
ncbi:MAG: hypothetical protein K6E27_00470 [Eubacterium sp.]|nr:hypothetical protein [Eubacterium sp.]